MSTSNSQAPQPLARLRAATATAHRNLEDQVDIARVCSSREGYERLLQDFLGFFEPLEGALQEIRGWEGRGFRWDERAKAHLLREDLRVLGQPDAAIAGLPRCADLPRPVTLAEAFGCAYVLEGSTLGGRHIVGVLAQSNIPPGARHYFSSYGEKVGVRWRDFCAMLDDFPEQEADAMIPHAEQTFDKLSAWLSRPR